MTKAQKSIKQVLKKSLYYLNEYSEVKNTLTDEKGFDVSLELTIAELEKMLNSLEGEQK